MILKDNVNVVRLLRTCLQSLHQNGPPLAPVATHIRPAWHPIFASHIRPARLPRLHACDVYRARAAGMVPWFNRIKSGV